MSCRIQFTFVLTVLTLVLSLVPAIIIWVVFMDLMTSSMDLLKNTTLRSTDSMAVGMQELLMAQAMETVNVRLQEGENEMLAQRSMVRTSGLQQYDLRPSRFDAKTMFLPYVGEHMFNTMKGHELFSTITTAAVIHRAGNIGSICISFAWGAQLVDILHGISGPRFLYSGTLTLDPAEQWATVNYTFVDQDTGTGGTQLSRMVFPTVAFTQVMFYNGWGTDLAFNIYTGQIEFGTQWWFPAQNDTWIQTTIAINAQTISDELKQQLADSPNDRLVLFFRQPHGHMVAPSLPHLCPSLPPLSSASHGKFFSHSDVDRRYVNVLKDPLNVSAYRLWTCLDSNDPFIQEACQQIYDTYQSWTAIPSLRQETVLSGQRYWVATAHSNFSLQCTVLMLKNRASVMGNIDASNQAVDDSLDTKKGVTFVVLGVVSAVAVLLPLSLGLWLAARLYTLAAGMDRIAKLQFTADATQPTLFSELHRFQTSFVKMERGLQAFGKFVPQAVVKVLIAGQMKANDEMNPETVTIMFADIEGFSTVCENVPPAVLVTVCTEYFEAMCSNITKRNGTIDKFIGDCIMAMWNAPDRLPGHEREAVMAALAMQSNVMEKHSDWKLRGLPVLKFRLGIHTGVCLVGNFGCSYRVNYTCLGDSVNLSARLEALNKKFGTYLCVSHGTYEACREDFHFRKLAKVTVPGKAEVLPVYEVLCPYGEGEAPDPARRLTPAKPPGTVSVVELESCISDEHVGLSIPLPPRPLPGVDSTDLATSDKLPYHWTFVDRAELLHQARQYEHAYEAMVAGNHAEARRILQAEPLLAVPDKAWAALADQLAHTAAGPWDGVFHFREK